VPDAAAFIARFDAVESRLAQHAGALYEALTDEDPDTHEQWAAGQVWAHVAEFVPYWMSELERIIGAGADAPVPFGRTKTDPGRLAAIERDRASDPAQLMSRVSAAVEACRVFVAELEPHEWAARGKHPTLGAMSVGSIVDRFVVGHLEEHAEQLDRLATADRTA
jgi:hypothetical protein